jgi:hypothetical protein
MALSYFEEYVATLTPYRHFKFNENTSTINTVDSGVRAVDGQHVNAAMSNQAVTSNADALNKGAQYVAASSYYTNTLANVFDPAGSDIGALFAVFNCSAGSSALMYLMDAARPSGSTSRATISINLTSGIMNMFIFTVASTDYRYRQWETRNFHDGLDHFVAIVNRGDGTGMHMYCDGVEDTTVTNGTAGADPGLNAFLKTVANSGFGAPTLFVGCLQRPVQSFFEGKIDHFSTVQGVNVTQQDITNLQTLRANPGFALGGGGGGGANRRARQQAEILEWAKKRQKYRMEKGIYRPNDGRNST